MTTKDGRAVARENDVRVLRALHRFGWLRTRDLAVLVWQVWARSPSDAPGLKMPTPTAAGLRMAQRTLRRLREKRRVLSSRAPDGSRIYALAEAGVRFLEQIGVAAVTGKDLIRTFSSAHFRHRCIANEIAISAIIEGFRVATEREIAQGRWLGGNCDVAGKRPDVLLRSTQLAWWVEVERSRKNAREYSALLSWLQLVKRDSSHAGGPPLPGGLRLQKVIFICTEAFRRRLVGELLKRMWRDDELKRLLDFSTSLYALQDITFSENPGISGMGQGRRRLH